MREVINVCLGQLAGHVQCHFNNQQESYLDYSLSLGAKIDPEVFLQPVLNRSDNTVSYNPRTILLDSENGYGSLGKYDYVDNEDDLMVANVERMQLQEPILKNEYQQLLDNPQLNKRVVLDKANTKYWTDYTRLIYDPLSLQQIPQWQNHNGEPVLKADLEKRPLVGYEQGIELFSNTDFMEDCFRVVLEKCDNVEGLNLVSQMDNSWGGVLDQVLIDVRDEYLPKSVISMWGLYDQSDERRKILSQIQLTMHGLSNASLFVPLDSGKYDNMWQSLGLLSMVFENVNLLYSKKSDHISMTDYVMGLTLGQSRKNLVTDVLVSDIQLSNNAFRVVGEKHWKHKSIKQSHVFSESIVRRYDDDTEVTNFQELQELGTPLKGLRQYDIDIPFQPPDSFPTDILPDNSTNYNVTMSLSDAPMRQLFKSWSRFVQQRMPRGEDQEWYIEEIENYLQEYEYGYSDDEDDF